VLAEGAALADRLAALPLRHKLARWFDIDSPARSSPEVLRYDLEVPVPGRGPKQRLIELGRGFPPPAGGVMAWSAGWAKRLLPFLPPPALILASKTGPAPARPASAPASTPSTPGGPFQRRMPPTLHPLLLQAVLAIPKRGPARPGRSAGGQPPNTRRISLAIPCSLVGLPGGRSDGGQALLAAEALEAGAVARGDRGGSGAGAAAPQPGDPVLVLGKGHWPPGPAPAGGRVLGKSKPEAGP